MIQSRKPMEHTSFAVIIKMIDVCEYISITLTYNSSFLTQCVCIFLHVRSLLLCMKLYNDSLSFSLMCVCVTYTSYLRTCLINPAKMIFIKKKQSIWWSVAFNPFWFIHLIHLSSNRFSYNEKISTQYQIVGRKWNQFYAARQKLS